MNTKFPSEKKLIELLIEFKSVKEVLKCLGKNYKTNAKLSRLAKQNNITLKSRKSYIRCTSDTKEDEKLVNFYKDDYEVDTKFKHEGHIWTIKSIKQDTKKIYHCINELGFRGSFHAIDIKEKALI